MICLTRLRGLSDAYGSWKIICSSRRYGRSSWRESDVMSSPPKRIVPLVGSSRRTKRRPSVDLPQPDSPTTPSVSPRRTSSETPSTACTTSPLGAPERRRADREVLDEVDGLEQDGARPVHAHALFRRSAGRIPGSR